MSTMEQLRSREAKSGQTSETAGERAAELTKSREHSHESPENRTERANRARHEAVEAIAHKESGGAESNKDTAPTYIPLPSRATSKQKAVAYKKTMTAIQRDMPTSARVFSKVIHTPAIEKTSEAFGSTVARPNAILFGSFFALVAVSAVFIVAKHYGYRLSGFESIGSFLVGWCIGLIVDYIRILTNGNRHR